MKGDGNMSKKGFEKRCYYSIRKFAIGAASVMIGASFFGVGVVEAAETQASPETEGTITQVQPMETLPSEVANLLKKADSEATQGNPTSSETKDQADSPTTETPQETPKPVVKPTETVSPVAPVAAPVTPPVVSPSQPTVTDLEDRPDRNHLEGARATASNHETGTNFTADKAVDGNSDTRWATDRDAKNPRLALTLPQPSLLTLVALVWDRRL